MTYIGIKISKSRFLVGFFGTNKAKIVYSVMKLIIIFGPGAVGKMTVGRELAKITGLKLFHNHMSLELANQFFDWNTEGFKKIDSLLRFGIFEIVAQSDLEGLIFTFVWAVNEKKEEDYIDRIVDIFAREGGEVMYVELSADLEQRLKRNKHDDRLREKPSKRDTAFTEKMILDHESKFQMNTKIGDLLNKEIFKIDNTKLEAAEVASMIKKQYNL